MNKCINCKFWSPFIYNGIIPDQAKCEVLSCSPEIYEDNSFIAVDMEGIYDDQGWEGEEVYDTGKNFGCIHFQPKKETTDK